MALLKVVNLLERRRKLSFSLAQDTSFTDSNNKRHGLLKDQVRLVKRKDFERYEIVPIHGLLSFDKGFFIVICACQLLAQKNDGIILAWQRKLEGNPKISK